MEIFAAGRRVGVAAAALAITVISGGGELGAGECQGNFGFEGPGFTLDGKPSDLLLEDLNGDGSDDIVVAIQDGASTVITIFFGQGDRTFAAPVTVPAGAQLSSLASADFDLDGDPDLVSAHGDVVLFFRNQGNGHLSDPVSIPVPSGTTHVVAGDLLGDGAPDLAVVHQFDAKVAVLENRGGGEFGVAITMDVGARNYGTRQPRPLAVGSSEPPGTVC